MTHKDVPKLQIKPKKYGAESSVFSIRIPKDMVKDLDEIAEKTGRTRNEIISISLEFAIQHLEITGDEG